MRDWRVPRKRGLPPAPAPTQREATCCLHIFVEHLFCARSWAPAVNRAKPCFILLQEICNSYVTTSIDDTVPESGQCCGETRLGRERELHSPVVLSVVLGVGQGQRGLPSRSEAQPKADGDWESIGRRGDRREFQAGNWMCKGPVAAGKMPREAVAGRRCRAWQPCGGLRSLCCEDRRHNQGSDVAFVHFAEHTPALGQDMAGTGAEGLR